MSLVNVSRESNFYRGHPIRSFFILFFTILAIMTIANDFLRSISIDYVLFDKLFTRYFFAIIWSLIMAFYMSRRKNKDASLNNA